MNVITSSKSWKDFSDKLSKLSKKEKGNAFEELTRLYLLTDPLYANLFDKVWHHTKIPENIKDLLDLPQTEIGIDLICKTKKNEYWAIQCKFHQDSNINLNIKELSTFFSETEKKIYNNMFAYRLVVSSAEGIGDKLKKRDSKNTGYLLYDVLSKLGESQFSDFRKILDGEIIEYIPFNPLNHQNVAIRKCKNYFNSKLNSRGRIIHPCGTGKSLLAYWCSRTLNAKTILIAVPSIALVRQTLNTWVRESFANKTKIDWIVICSDDDASTIDDNQDHIENYDIPVTTNPHEINNFFKDNDSELKILITTYQSSKTVTDGLKKLKITFDLGIYDEAHKTVGHKDKHFAHLLYDENIMINRRIFMTATERVYRGKSEDFTSMDDNSIYGDIIDQLSFKRALEENPPILSDYKIVSAIITKSEIENLISNNKSVKPDGSNWTIETDASSFASMIMIKKLIKEKNIHHIVSFHKSIKRSKDFKKLMEDSQPVDQSFNDLKLFHVNGKDSSGKRASILNNFKNSEKSLITNARCLTEGVDVPTIDAVLFADPKHSKIDIVQAAGRALRTSNDKKFGYILIPVVVDINDNALSTTAYEQIVSTIIALGIHDTRIIDEYKEISEGKKGDGGILDFDVPEVIKINYQDFLKNTNLKIWDRFNYTWENVFRELKAYVKKHGDALVKQTYEVNGLKLGWWISSRRREYKKNLLSLNNEQKRQLESLKGWTWESKSKYIIPGNLSKFRETLSTIQEYINKNGSSNIGRPTTENKKYWGPINAVRRHYKNKTLDDERIKMVESINGWIWENQSIGNKRYGRKKYNIDSMISALEKYVKEHGTSKVPVKCKVDNLPLGIWLKDRQNEYRKGILKMNVEQIEKIESFPGWSWGDKNKKKYEKRKSVFVSKGILNNIFIEEVNIFIKNHGHAKIPQLYQTRENHRLGRLINTLRTQYKSKTLNNKNKSICESIEGWVWSASRGARRKKVN